MTMDINDFTKEELDGFVFVDIREPAEILVDPCKAFEYIELPLSQYPESDFQFCEGKKYVIFCAKGGRSLPFTQQLHEQGVTNVASLNDGIEAIKGYSQSE